MDFSQLVMEARDGRSVKIRSGEVEPGDIFVALSGTTHLGADFIPEALDKGAFLALTDPATAKKIAKDRVMGHPDTAHALGELARAHYHTDKVNLAVTGITGTNGKTTTSYLLEHIFTSSGFKTGVMGTVNYRWPGSIVQASMTTPDCLELHRMLALMDKAGVEMVIMEVSSHALAQNRVAGIDFDAGIFTNLSQDHLDYHKDMESYFKAKSRLFLGHARKPSFRAIINADDEYGRILLKFMPQALGFGLEKSAFSSLRGRLIKNDRTGLILECEHAGRSWRVCSPLSGTHNSYNLLAAQGAALSMGLGPQHLACLESSGQAPGRLEKVSNTAGLDIFVDYAHTPDALENVCRALKGLDFSRLIVLFGCGGNRDRSKRPLMGLAVSGHADVVFLTSDNPRDEDPLSIIEDIRPGLSRCPELFIQPDRRKALEMAVNFMRPGDALLVAGKGHETYQEIRGVRSPFSDVLEIEKILSRRMPQADGCVK